ncbi:MAG: Uma2 family endonuclease [Deltaproteobacteria bacterium]|nr:Uma2 family endonuclease [Deltaproteobacteria bacterium]MBI3387706.1 Uma2 family endonuclease [Deltaproteobacteria bacterium]
MRSLPNALKLDYDDYCRFPNDGKRYELIDGALHVSPSPVTIHQKISARLMVRLYAHVEAAQLGTVLAAPMDVILSRHDIVQPDLLFISNERADIITEKNIQGAPDLLVEILSQDREHDLVTKRRLYARYGVTEYWIIDPTHVGIQTFRRPGRARFFRPPVTIRRMLTTALLPGFALDVRDLWR